MIEERGYFWLIEHEIPENQFAPNNGTYGTLRITRSGRVTLETDGFLEGFKDEKSEGRPINHIVAGTLKSDGRSVILHDVASNGKHLSSYGISYEKYLALFCLVSHSRIADLKSWANQISVLKVGLSGFEEWLSVRPIDINSDESVIKIEYRPPTEKVFSLSDRVVIIKHDLKGPWHRKTNDVKAKLIQKSSFVYQFKKPISVSQAAVEAHRLHDLMIVLTDYETRIGWPSVYGDNDKSPATLYFIRAFKSNNTFEWKRAWTRLSDIEYIFDKILETWISRFDEIGPGFYMYSSTRRGTHMYLEQRFMSLMWGLEALHRACKVVGRDKGTEERVSRILEALEGDDRDWLAKRLGYAAEFSLSRRLSGMIEEIGLNITKKQRNKFADQCAKIRNDVSHFGRIDRAGNREGAYAELNSVMPALSHLYHAIILIEIGVPRDIVLRALRSPITSGHATWYFRRSGLAEISSRAG